MSAKAKEVVSTQSLEVEVPELKIERMKIRLVGKSPLLCHRFDEKAKATMLKAQRNEAEEMEPKDPQDCFLRSLYPLPDGKGYGFPAIGFKKAAVTAAKDANMFKTDVRRWFFVMGYLIPIKFKANKEGLPRMQEDTVRIGRGMTDLRYRGAFDEWSCDLEIEYNANQISPGQILHIFSLAGFGVGIGEWRPERDGGNGRFDVAPIHQVK